MKITKLQNIIQDYITIQTDNIKNPIIYVSAILEGYYHEIKPKDLDEYAYCLVESLPVYTICHQEFLEETPDAISKHKIELENSTKLDITLSGNDITASMYSIQKNLYDDNLTFEIIEYIKDYEIYKIEIYKY